MSQKIMTLSGKQAAGKQFYEEKRFLFCENLCFTYIMPLFKKEIQLNKNES